MGKTEEVFNERNILSKLHHPNVVKLHSCFTDKKNMYMVFDFAQNGDFSQFLNRQSKDFIKYYLIPKYINFVSLNRMFKPL
jgi:serine/threonine protein kinase